ncbi:hypothetical protein IE81DRAFT_326307 [Ceraceosorus guamensis]|uniref:NAD(P)-binding protein n=1 Tax=Ceraceosorus guamensis TaxID=1522189 RepID=A0A316VR07_9BASI|nr:hypothetical protein IE81DRAFT_326307 [Ceraceosorus guamensis]PWN39654.1 hypothetical protein IE81DRAFT_326307 [Ceraceosorus guamensis]
MARHTLIVATGGHSGLGFQTLHQLLQRAPASLPPPYHLILFGRASSASSTGVDRLSSLCSADTASKLEYRSLDLDDLAATKSAGAFLADEVKAKHWSISTFFFNAAIWPAKRESVKSHDDEGEREVDKCLAVNHIAHLLFLQPLLPLLLERAYIPDDRAPRIVFTNSSLHRRADPSTLESLFDLTKSGPEGWTGRACYSASKFIQILGARKLAEQLEEQLTLKGGDAVAPELVIVQPGFVPSTGLARSSPLSTRLFMKAFSYLPLSFIESEMGAGETLLKALSAPLSSLQATHTPDARTADQLSQLNEQGSPIRWTPKDARVQGAMIVRGGGLDLPDPRTENEALQQTWWPL